MASCDFQTDLWRREGNAEQDDGAQPFCHQGRDEALELVDAPSVRGGAKSSASVTKADRRVCLLLAERR